MLDNDRGPNREGGCQTCYGAVDINNSDYKTIIRNSHYYIIAHLSSVVKPGAVRISHYRLYGQRYYLFCFRKYGRNVCLCSDKQQ